MGVGRSSPFWSPVLQFTLLLSLFSFGSKIIQSFLELLGYEKFMAIKKEEEEEEDFSDFSSLSSSSFSSFFSFLCFAQTSLPEEWHSSVPTESTSGAC